MSVIEQLQELRDFGGKALTSGLDDASIAHFAAGDPQLGLAIAAALEAHRRLQTDDAEFLRLDEAEQIRQAQSGFVNFYPDDAINRYLPAAAQGPWIVTLKGAVLHDNGGYGMLGFGHNDPAILTALARPQVMANIMTPSVAQRHFAKAVQRELGHRRGGSPYARLLCLNSGSEAVSLACRIADIHAKHLTDPDGRHAGRRIKRLAVKGAFHGRTDRPALYSDSSHAVYRQHLASYREQDSLLTVEPYDLEQLQAVFAEADRQGWFIEAMFLEPVMGEGDPGRAVTPEFYAAARQLTADHGSLLLVDSIQAGLRAHGVLSLIDYPGFETLPPPDFETFSKALNGGQYPLSILAVSEQAAGLYRKGVYGNTMTGNPRALEVAIATLGQLNDNVRQNIRERGEEVLQRLNQLKEELPGLITKVQGTGLLFSCELAEAYKCYGEGSIEEYMRSHGIGVIHGGTRSLRFTPHFRISSAEIGLIIDKLRHALLHGPRQTGADRS